MVVHFVEERAAGRARLAVWVMYWHMYVIVAICRESERPEEAVVADGESKRARDRVWEKESERRIAGKRRVVMRAERASGGQRENFESW